MPRPLDRRAVTTSYVLLLIAIAHASVWTIGVVEAHSKEFFLREHDSIQAAAVAAAASPSGPLAAEGAAAHLLELEQRVKEKAEEEAAAASFVEQADPLKSDRRRDAKRTDVGPLPAESNPARSTAEKGKSNKPAQHASAQAL